MIRDNPESSARALATELQAELAIGGEATEAALGRLSRGATAPVSSLRPPPPPPGPQRGQDLERLSLAMRRAEETRDRTRRAVAERLSRSFNTGIAIHPDTMRRAADELIAARAALARARRGRAPAGHQVARRLRAGATGGLAAAGVAIGALGALPLGAVVATVGLAGGAVTAVTGRQAVLATVPLLEASEQLALRRWEQLAGVGADPTDVEAAIHRYDPQHRVITDLLINSPAVRAADQLALHHRMAWVHAWRVEVGDAPAPEAPVGPAVDAPGFARSETTVDLRTDPSRTLVVVGPYTELSEERARALHRRLLTLPGGNRVIVVLGPDAVGGNRTVVDLRDPVGAGRPTPGSTDADPSTAQDHEAETVDVREAEVGAHRADVPTSFDPDGPTIEPLGNGQAERDAAAESIVLAVARPAPPPMRTSRWR